MDGESAAPGNNVYFSGNGGNSWQQLTLPAGVYANTALSCSTNQQCSFGGGQFSGVDSNGKPLMDPVLVSTANAGASWNVEKLPLPTNGAFELLGNVYVSSLQCFSASNCDVILLASFGVNFGRPDYSYVEDNVFMQTTDGGHSWSSVILPGQPAPNSSTALSDVGPINVNAMSCPSTQLCIASTSVSFAHGNSSIVWRTDNGGATWTVGSLPNGLTSVGPISCPDTQHCWIVAWPTSGGVDSLLLESSDGGASWINRSPQGLPSSTTWDTASCPTVNNCWLAGKTQGADSTAVVYATSDAGQTWNAASLPTEVGAESAPLKGVDTIGCNANLTCIVLGIPTGVSEDGVNEAVLTNAAGH